MARPLSPGPLAHVVYALCGHGRGHASRAVAVAEALRPRGHRVTFAADAPAADRLDNVSDGAVYRVPGLRQVLHGNRVRMGATARANLALTWRSPEIVADAARWLGTVGADVVVADHEPFVARGAQRIGVPVVALSHQLVLTEARPRAPLRSLPSRLGTALGIAVLAPTRPDAVVVPSFFFPPPRRGSTAVFVPPILRDDVLRARPRAGRRLLVYVNEGEGMGALLDALGHVGAPADVYGLGPGPGAPPNVRLRPPSRAGFLADLAGCRAVVATAGFTLLSEALHLGKPVLALPNRGFFEQTVNALALREQGWGEAVLDRDLRADDLRGFLDRADGLRQRAAAGGTVGRERAADVIERVLGAATPAARVAA
ncbi:glycosyltransferase family protein [Rubrivirga sp.]|uniref:glycosyltransferase family protein n=1 Tax=Rubrivirga sp. TaxID=1885344 RepID=UPI003B52A270